MNKTIIFSAIYDDISSDIHSTQIQLIINTFKSLFDEYNIVLGVNTGQGSGAPPIPRPRSTSSSSTWAKLNLGKVELLLVVV